jgi:hypothetical protein
LVDLARGRAEQAFERAQAARQQKAASGLGYFERLLLEVELTAATTLGRTDDVSALTARLEELIQQAESV